MIRQQMFYHKDNRGEKAIAHKDGTPVLACVSLNIKSRFEMFWCMISSLISSLHVFYDPNPRHTEKHLNEAKYVNGKGEQGSLQTANERAVGGTQERGEEIEPSNNTKQ